MSFESDFTKSRPPDLQLVSAPVDRSDFVADYPGDSFTIAVDGHCKLGW